MELDENHSRYGGSMLALWSAKRTTHEESEGYKLKVLHVKAPPSQTNILHGERNEMK